MIGYKATDMDGCCRGFRFEVGIDAEAEIAKEGGDVGKNG